MYQFQYNASIQKNRRPNAVLLPMRRRNIMNAKLYKGLCLSLGSLAAMYGLLCFIGLPTPKPTSYLESLCLGYYMSAITLVIFNLDNKFRWNILDKTIPAMVLISIYFYVLKNVQTYPYLLITLIAFFSITVLGLYVKSKLGI